MEVGVMVVVVMIVVLVGIVVIVVIVMVVVHRGPSENQLVITMFCNNTIKKQLTPEEHLREHLAVT